MQPPEALRSTALAPGPRMQAPHPPPPPDPGARRIAVTAIAVAVVLLVGLAIGVAIGRATAGGGGAVAPAPVPALGAPELGQLGVTSQPADGNVTVDGRFVGVTPVARLDLDPGKHTIVIDAFGYQPYAGTLTIEPRAKVALKVLLAPVGGTGATSGDVTGAGRATNVSIPASALLPSANAVVGAPAAGAAGAAAVPAPARPAPPVAAPPPPRPRRECSSERGRCRDGCSRAESDCRTRCPYCGSCPTNLGWDECNRQCATCRTSCEHNLRFCESGCDSQYDNCEASQ